MAVLGELERSIMDVLWGASAPLSVHDVRQALPRELAYTTVMTVLDRLAKKGIVDRELAKRAWLYRSRCTLPELVAAEVAAVIAESDPERHASLEAVVGLLSDADKDFLRATLAT